METNHPVTLFILLSTLATSLIGFSNAEFWQRFMCIPQRVVHQREYYRLLSSALVHADVMHLAFNMFAFYSFGGPVESILGPVGMALLYLVGALVSDIPTVLRHRDNPHYRSLGASGAVSAVVFSFVLFAPNAQLLVFFLLPMPAWLFAVLYMAYSSYAARHAQDNINHSAHLWGALTGLVFTIVWIPRVLPYFIDQLF